MFSSPTTTRPRAARWSFPAPRPRRAHPSWWRSSSAPTHQSCRQPRTCLCCQTCSCRRARVPARRRQPAPPWCSRRWRRALCPPTRSRCSSTLSLRPTPWSRNHSHRRRRPSSGSRNRELASLFGRARRSGAGGERVLSFLSVCRCLAPPTCPPAPPPLVPLPFTPPSAPNLIIPSFQSTIRFVSLSSPNGRTGPVRPSTPPTSSAFSRGGSLENLPVR